MSKVKIPEEVPQEDRTHEDVLRAETKEGSPAPRTESKFRVSRPPPRGLSPSSGSAGKGDQRAVPSPARTCIHHRGPGSGRQRLAQQRGLMCPPNSKCKQEPVWGPLLQNNCFWFESALIQFKLVTELLTHSHHARVCTDLALGVGKRTSCWEDVVCLKQNKTKH